MCEMVSWFSYAAGKRQLQQTCGECVRSHGCTSLAHSEFHSNFSSASPHFHRPGSAAPWKCGDALATARELETAAKKKSSSGSL